MKDKGELNTQRIENSVPADEEVERDARTKILYADVEDKLDEFFFVNPYQVSWAIVGEKSQQIIGSGRDEDLPDDEAHDAWEEEAGEALHIFGRPIDTGVDGMVIRELPD